MESIFVGLLTLLTFLVAFFLGRKFSDRSSEKPANVLKALKSFRTEAKFFSPSQKQAKDKFMKHI